MEFDKYDGPPYFPDDARAKTVPVFRSTRDFLKGSAPCARTQFPLTIAYAVTIHKSQGMSMDRAVVDISE